MPLVKLHISKEKPQKHRHAACECIEKALIEAFRIPTGDTTVLISDYDQESVYGKSEDFTFIEILAISGRSREAKKTLYRALVDNLCAATSLKPTDCPSSEHLAQIVA